MRRWCPAGRPAAGLTGRAASEISPASSRNRQAGHQGALRRGEQRDGLVGGHPARARRARGPRWCGPTAAATAARRCRGRRPRRPRRPRAAHVVTVLPAEVRTSPSGWSAPAGRRQARLLDELPPRSGQRRPRPARAGPSGPTRRPPASGPRTVRPCARGAAPGRRAARNTRTPALLQRGRSRCERTSVVRGELHVGPRDRLDAVLEEPAADSTARTRSCGGMRPDAFGRSMSGS